MINIPISPKVIHVPLVSADCLYGTFDSTYPIDLNGIIDPDEFQQSIANINRSFSLYKKYFMMCWLISITTAIVGIVVLIVSWVRTQTESRIALLIGVILMFVIGLLIIIISSFYFFTKRVKQTRHTVEEESAKYSSRSIPCSWELHVSKKGVVGYILTLKIEIGSSNHQGNNTSVYFSNKASYDQESNDAPPSYSIAISTYCPQCNKLRQDLNGKFCSGCGHKFSTY
ncbi:hypothetical protein I4U23_022019 [Adineta vaga]|nr:hypothetical protein I4U23_022019 [Adineta vaga]